MRANVQNTFLQDSPIFAFPVTSTCLIWIKQAYGLPCPRLDMCEFCFFWPLSVEFTSSQNENLQFIVSFKINLRKNLSDSLGICQCF